MRPIRTADLPIAKLKLPGKWKKSLDQSVLDGLVAEMQRGSVLPPIGVTGDHRVVYGLHRVAAAKLLGWERIRADVLDCTPAEAALLSLAENARRRRLDDAALTAAIAALTAKPPASARNDSTNDAAHGSHDPRTAAGHRLGTSEAARAIAAKAAGVSESTVKRAARRSQAAQEATGAPEPACQVDPRAAYDEKRAALARLLLDVAGKLSGLVGVLTTASHEHGWAHTDWQRLRGVLQASASEVRVLAPAADCRYCEQLPEGGGNPDCPACHGSGYLSQAQLANLPRELRA